MKPIETKSGVALIWTLITITILLIVSSTMANYIIRESQMSVRIEDSTQAYAIAQSGIEWAKEYVANNPGANYSGSEFVMLGGKVTVTIQFNAPVLGQTTVTSLGVFAGVNRKLEYVISKSQKVLVVNESVIGHEVFAMNGNYFYQFDLWGASPAVRVGLSTSSGPINGPAANTKTLAVYYDGSNKTFDLKSYYNLETVSSSGPVTISDGPDVATPYAWRVRVDYLQSTAARLTIYRRDSITSDLVCVGTSTTNLSEKDFTMTTAYLASDQTLNPSTAGDGNVINILNSFVDNLVLKGATM